MHNLAKTFEYNEKGIAMIFDSLWNIVLGICGGIISSIIVSRVFLIQSEYQNQLRVIGQSVRKLGMVSGYLNAVKAVFEVSYDGEIEMQREMKEKGYKSESEYYIANRDKDWISKSALLENFLAEVKKTAELVKNDIIGEYVNDNLLNKLLNDIMKYITEVLSLKEFTFSQLNKLEKLGNSISKDYEDCKHISTKQVLRILLRDRTMIVLYIILGMITVGTATSYFWGV